MIFHLLEYVTHSGTYCILHALPEHTSAILGDRFVLSNRKEHRATHYPHVGIVMHRGQQAPADRMQILEYLNKTHNLLTVVNDSGRKALTYVFVGKKAEQE